MTTPVQTSQPSSMPGTTTNVLFLCLLLALTTAFLSGQATPVPAASVVVRFQDGKASFRVGEEIRLELEFRGKASEDFYFSTETYDRSGRMLTEQYAITPGDGFVDPLSDMFVDGMIGGGLRSTHPLDGTPFILNVTLNDWVRFTKPGRYRLVITSSRLHRRSSQTAPALTSSEMDFTIAAQDDAWVASQMNRATMLIAGGKRDEVIHGASLLRYLDTEAAAKTILDRYDAIVKASAWDIDAALTASSHRSFIVKQMEMRLDERADIDANFVPTLARIRALLDVPPAAGNNAARLDRVRSLRTEYDGRRQAALAGRPVTSATLREQLVRFVNVSPDLQQQIGRDLAANPVAAAEAFAGLPPESDLQKVLLEFAPAWSVLNRPWILPALRQVYEKWKGNSNGWATGDTVLKRLYEVSPEEGRRLILEEIRTGARQIGYDALAILPEPSLPELDDALQLRYALPQSTATTTWLIARYGSPKLLPFVTNTLAKGAACGEEAGFIVYLLKHEPATAMQRLSPGFDRRLICSAPPLAEVSARYWDDRIESATIAQLAGTDNRNVADAAQVLGSHGSRAGKQPLLDRLVKWSAEWKGREDELNALRPGIAEPTRVENSITNALFQNIQFALTKDDVSRILALCVTSQCRTNVSGRGSRIQ